MLGMWRATVTTRTTRPPKSRHPSATIFPFSSFSPFRATNLETIRIEEKGKIIIGNNIRLNRRNYYYYYYSGWILLNRDPLKGSKWDIDIFNAIELNSVELYSIERVNFYIFVIEIIFR